jgi:nitrite reductase/ring-hydroxylating ferredoxin subunit
MVDPRDSFDTGLRTSDVDAERPRPLDTPWGSFSIFTCAGKLLAAQSFCPHLMGPLFQGTISGETVTCPWHEWRFSLATGRRLDVEGQEMPGEDRLLLREVALGPRGTILLVVPRRDGVPPP